METQTKLRVDLRAYLKKTLDKRTFNNYMRKVKQMPQHLLNGKLLKRRAIIRKDDDRFIYYTVKYGRHIHRIKVIFRIPDELVMEKFTWLPVELKMNTVADRMLTPSAMYHDSNDYRNVPAAGETMESYRDRASFWRKHGRLIEQEVKGKPIGKIGSIPKKVPKKRVRV